MLWTFSKLVNRITSLLMLRRTTLLLHLSVFWLLTSGRPRKCKNKSITRQTSNPSSLLWQVTQWQVLSFLKVGRYCCYCVNKFRNIAVLVLKSEWSLVAFRRSYTRFHTVREMTRHIIRMYCISVGSRSVRDKVEAHFHLCFENISNLF